MTPSDLTSAIVAELAVAIQAGLGKPVSVAVGPAAGGVGWTSALDVGGPLTGSLTYWVSATGTRTVAVKLLGMDDEPEPSVLADMLKEMWQQALGVVRVMPEFGGTSLTIAPPQAGAMAGGQGWALSVDDDVLAHVLVSGSLVVAAVPASSATGASTAVAAATPPARALAARDAADDSNLAALMDIDLPLVVRFARTDMTLKGLSELGPGSIVDMGRSPEDPVEVLVGGQVFARGEVVVVNGNYGVRITSVLGPAERLRALEAGAW